MLSKVRHSREGGSDKGRDVLKERCRKAVMKGMAPVRRGAEGRGFKGETSVRGNGERKK